jgi:hypothetical protein
MGGGLLPLAGRVGGAQLSLWRHPAAIDGGARDTKAPRTHRSVRRLAATRQRRRRPVAELRVSAVTGSLYLTYLKPTFWSTLVLDRFSPGTKGVRRIPVIVFFVLVQGRMASGALAGGVKR